MQQAPLDSKSKLHPRNKHRARYDFKKLTAASPELAPHVQENKFGNESIDFFDPKAVKALNKAILRLHYNIQEWDIPKDYLCPPIPGRADYIHYAADLLANDNQQKVPTGEHINCLDIGVGASCVYPIIGNAEYGWSFIGTDIDPVSLKSSQQIARENLSLDKACQFRLQYKKKQVLKGVFKKSEKIDLIVCNPPFHSSAAEAARASSKKLSNLKGKRIEKATLNFGGQHNELWCQGGEYQFVRGLIAESKAYALNCCWFTALISKKTNLRHMQQALESLAPTEVRVIEMSQGNKSSRIICWTFLSQKQRTAWANDRW